MTAGQQEDQGGWWGAGKERVVGSEVRDNGRPDPGGSCRLL